MANKEDGSLGLSVAMVFESKVGYSLVELMGGFSFLPEGVSQIEQYPNVQTSVSTAVQSRNAKIYIIN